MHEPSDILPRRVRAGIGSGWSWVALATAAWLGAAPQPVRACSCAAFSFSANLEDGQSDVALDFVPVVDGRFDRVEFETTSGSPVGFEPSQFSEGVCGGSSLELRPRKPLAANTDYVLRASATAGGMQEVRFTTGTTRTGATALPAPEVSAIAFENDSRDSCNTSHYPCLQLAAPDPDAGLAAARWFELTFTRAGTQVGRYLVSPRSPSGRVSLMFDDSHTANCVELRERDAAGRRSDPTVLCGSHFPIRPGWFTACEQASAEDFPPQRSGISEDDSAEASGWPAAGAVAAPGYAAKPTVGCSVHGATDASTPRWIAIAIALSWSRWRTRRRSSSLQLRRPG